MKIINSLIELKKRNEIQRLGTIFKTEKNSYFYDTGTGKVIKLDNISETIINELFYSNININNADDLTINEKDLEEFNKFALDENLFQAYEPKELFSIDHCNNLENAVENICIR